MLTFCSQNRQQSSKTLNKMRLTVSQFKFKGKYPHLNIRDQDKKVTSCREGIFSQQISRSASQKNSNFKGYFGNGSTILLPEEKEIDGRSKMFLTSKQRSPSKKTIFPLQKIIQETRKQSLSQKNSPKIRQLKERQTRKKKEKIICGDLQKLPIELYTRKLQWKEKEKKRMIPFVNEAKVKLLGSSRNHRQKMNLLNVPVSGWENKQEDFYFFEL